MVDSALVVGANGRKSRILGDVETFLRGSFIRDDCDRVEIRHRTANGSSRVRDWTIKDLDQSERTPEWLAAQVVETGQNEAAALKGIVQYWVLVYRKGEEEHCARLPMHMQGKAVDAGEDLLGDSENGATAAGQMAQAHRHVEGFARIAIGGMSQVMQYQQGVIRQLCEWNERMAEREDKVMTMRETLESAKHERQLEAIRTEAAEARKNRLLDKAELFAPVILGKLAPKDKAIQQMAAVDAMRQTFKSLRPDQFEKLMAVLDNEQSVAVMTAYKIFLAEEEEKEKAEKERKEKEQTEEAAQ